jgi:hypothetical protein
MNLERLWYRQTSTANVNCERALVILSADYRDSVGQVQFPLSDRHHAIAHGGARRRQWLASQLAPPPLLLPYVLDGTTVLTIRRPPRPMSPRGKRRSSRAASRRHSCIRLNLPDRSKAPVVGRRASARHPRGSAKEFPAGDPQGVVEIPTGWTAIPSTPWYLAPSDPSSAVQIRRIRGGATPRQPRRGSRRRADGFSLR